MTTTSITFDSAGITLAGDLYTPDDGGQTPRAAVVVGHPGSGVKEQTAGLYAGRLAAAGFVALAFDAAHQGESGGLPRGLEDPARRVEDVKDAVSFLTAHPLVDAGRIGALGICASGGYVLQAAAGDPRIRAVAGVSTVDIARQFRLGADGTQPPEVFSGLLAAAASARSTEARGDVSPVLTLFPATVEEARAQGGEHGAEGFDYYRTARGQHPRSASFVTWPSVDRMAGFDALGTAALLGDRPLLLVAGTRAVTSWMSVEALQRATGPKELAWIEGASHVSLYDDPDHVAAAVERLSAFFTRALGTG